MEEINKNPFDLKGFLQLMNENRSFEPPKELSSKAHFKTPAEYDENYQNSIKDPDRFWLKEAMQLEWFQKPTTCCSYNWDLKKGPIFHTFFEDGTLNVSVNCLDRHLKSKIKSKPAIIWQGDHEDEVRIITYEELSHLVSKFANVLIKNGIQKGDTVTIYMPMIPESAVAMLACARIGAIHSVVFGGFSAEALKLRIHDSESKLLITSNVSIRGGKKISLKTIADEALTSPTTIKQVIVVKRDQDQVVMVEGRDIWYHEEMENSSDQNEPAIMNAEDPLFVLYTSGSTGKPKGVLHTQAGYLLYAAFTHKVIFDIQENDIYFCTADIGWITGHSYLIYGPLANGSTIVMFEGIPTYPDPGRFWQIIDKFKVTIFYTAPTAIRALIATGSDYPLKYSLDSLRILGTVGEPINPEAWIWYYQLIGKGKCPIIDTWWQTETGGIMIAPLPGCHTIKPGSASKPFFGIEPEILNEEGSLVKNNEGGYLTLKRPWPGMMRSLFKNQPLFEETYFTKFQNHYYTGDGAREDDDHDYWLLGRIDDVINVSGHRIGTSEVESALVSHEAVAEAAVVPVAHEIKGQGLYAFLTLMENTEPTDELKTSIQSHIRKVIGPIAILEKIQFAKRLPKTRSGKIMRRLLKKIAAKEIEDLGDISTLADMDVIAYLLKENDE